MSHERSIALKPKRRSPPLLLASKLDEHDEESNLPINNTVKRTCPSGSMENLDDAEANRRHILEFRARQKEDLEKNPWKYKGRGRYADQMPKPGEKSFNAEFTIDPSFNAGRDFAFKGVERKKSVRKRMHAFDCDCCKDYYENIGPMPPPAGPVWRAPFDSASSKERPQNELIPSSSSKKRQYGAGEEESGFDRDELLRLDYSEDETENRGVFSDKNDDEAAERAKKLKREQEIQNHKQMTSRHRDHGIPNLTPPGYWMINFPSTQEQEQINREAKAMEKKTSGTGMIR
ncbi:hypothetical protein IE53DRAFT_287105 [Violaceomyces palustris]|uniref:Uncharacterized protein n=1 Tax=Violaceomyces palustris TaxID=1673888 RepID=A0ACD0P2R5_9BASI|nr:hypothetical protein IE53DRAFT_287105 [Violaceomyces palustris]